MLSDDVDAELERRKVPRFAITISLLDPDTGKTLYDIAAGADDLRDFTKQLPRDDQLPGVRTELQRMFKYFGDQVREMERDNA